MSWLAGVRQLNLPQAEVKVIFVNARAQPLSHILNPGDDEPYAPMELCTLRHLHLPASAGVGYATQHAEFCRKLPKKLFRRGETGPAASPLDYSPSYSAVMLIFLVRFSASAVLGRVTVKMPFLKAASTLSPSTSQRSGMVRWKEPYERSTR